MPGYKGRLKGRGRGAEGMHAAWLLLGCALGHMRLAEPPARKFQYFRNGVGQNQDYTIEGPLEDYRTFPCQGKQQGPVTRKYRAGSHIKVTLSGDKTGEHNGGHCQFAMTYDEKRYVVLKTVLGNCISETKNYSVRIPRSAPSGRVTFVWTWVNRSGNREFYMNCADIRITRGKERGRFRGREILIAHIDASNRTKYSFPELDFDSHAKQYYRQQKKHSIRPKTKKRRARPGK